MAIAIAVLISIVCSLGISLYFQKLNKDKKDWDKFKKFADDRTEKMQLMYKKIKEELNMLLTEFKSQQTQANAAINLFTNKNKELKEKIDYLQDNINAVDNIEKQIAHYSEILTELNEMTVSV